jgi:2-oxo-4-hydroxy-4-carboxy-5-ureidoimidazoline decarboxylase
MLLAAFNTLPPRESIEALRACCDSPRWARMITAGRPYGGLAELTARSAEALASLTDAQIHQVVATHPRIGERPTGGDPHSTWSRQEQARVAGADAALRTTLAAANRRYERRFGHVFLICAAGRSGADLLAALDRRLGNPPDAELTEIRAQLALIVHRRLEGLIRP